MTFDLKTYFSHKQQTIDVALRERWMLPITADPAKLQESMHYSLFAKGKRIRPILVMATAEAIDVPQEDVLPIAAALEMIHVFSLIHDDLPCMDDDDFRRGQPTNHKVYGEATAVLAGDSLLARSFIALSDLDTQKYSAQNILKIIKRMGKAAGDQGMIAGQVIDLESEGKDIGLERLKTLHKNKTGALIRMAVEGPALLKGVSDSVLQNLITYGEAIGLAFQIADDILDIEGDEKLGKDIGSDIEKGKATYPALMGLDEAKAEAKRVLQLALDSLADFGEAAKPLRAIARFIVNRDH